VTPERFEDFVEFVVPELQRQGVSKRDYASGTCHKELFGRSPPSSRRPAAAS
jgi:alkanesulfonate monooxygenase